MMLALSFGSLILNGCSKKEPPTIAACWGVDDAIQLTTVYKGSVGGTTNQGSGYAFIVKAPRAYFKQELVFEKFWSPSFMDRCETGKVYKIIYSKSAIDAGGKLCGWGLELREKPEGR